MATNRADTLDPALLRPGRLDRKIEFPMPDRRQKRLIFATITNKMNLSEDVDLDDYVARPDKISGADINAICQEVCKDLHFTLLILPYYGHTWNKMTAYMKASYFGLVDPCVCMKWFFLNWQTFSEIRQK